MIYLDNAANRALNKYALGVAISKTNFPGNPSSKHRLGKKQKNAIDLARTEILNEICGDGCIYFTSGATESNNLALRSLAEIGRAKNKNHFITTEFEHSSVRRLFKVLESEGFDVTYIKPDKSGVIDFYKIKNAIRDNTIAVSMMFINNEIGTIQPVKRVGKLCRENNIYFHCDGVQAVGSIPVDIQDLNIDYLTASAHKFGGMTGVGFLYESKRLKGATKPIMYGGNQNYGIRPGTESPIAIVCMAEALKIANTEIDKKRKYVSTLRNELQSLLTTISGSKYNGSIYEDERSPGILNISFKDVSGDELALLLSERDICVSTASACSSSFYDRNYVTKSIDIPEDYINGTIRISLSVDNKEEEIILVFNAICEIIDKIRARKIGGNN